MRPKPRNETKKPVWGRSPAMLELSDLVDLISRSSANVLITGESGTGKEVVAHAIHDRGTRSSRPFVGINCAAIPEGLLESELFGHAKGAFTGASERKIGLFEEANGGTLFLDEIGDMSVPLQTKILRVIQERQLRAVGENSQHPIDVRIVAATHRDLRAEIEAGRFREDLYFRLSVVPVSIPPLRKRREDIPLLVSHFLEIFCRKYGAAGVEFSRGAMVRLTERAWKGNVRELENFVERVVVLHPGKTVSIEELPAFDEEVDPEAFYRQSVIDFPTLEQLEKRYISLVLHKTSGRRGKAASILGINRRTLYRKVKDTEGSDFFPAATETLPPALGSDPARGRTDTD